MLAHNLSDDFIKAYQSWHTNTYPQQSSDLSDLVTHGQKPQAMIISCCDSRVQAESLFNAKAGTFFMHRNIANFIPHASQGDMATPTAAALEYAIKALNVPHIIIMGHSQCGGVKGCLLYTSPSPRDA